MITFVQYFGTTEDERTPQGARFVDNRRFEGPITEMVEEAELIWQLSEVLLKNTR